MCMNGAWIGMEVYAIVPIQLVRHRDRIGCYGGGATSTAPNTVLRPTGATTPPRRSRARATASALSELCKNAREGEAVAARASI